MDMTPHPDLARFHRWLNADLSAEENQEIEVHLQECPDCVSAVERLTDLPPELHLLLSGQAATAATTGLGKSRPWPGRLNRPAPSAGLPTLPGFEMIAELGRGGMGIVYKARQPSLDRLVAIKVLREGDLAGPDDLARFRREAEAAARLQHANIVQVYEVGQHEGRPFLALEFVEGDSLARKVAVQPLPAREAAQIVRTLADTMHAAHQGGVIHRDLKPANVLLTTQGVPKITDFGLAKRLDAPSGQTCSGAILGTASYMPPEQARGDSKQVGPAADVYALGAILYELLTGRPPFKAASQTDTLLQVLRDEPMPPRRLQPSVPRDLETVCVKCLEKEPGKRYASAAALADDLQRFLAGEPIRARPVSRVERLWRWCRRKPWVAGLAAALLLASVGSIALGAWALSENLRRAEADARRQKALAEAEKEKSERLRATTLPLIERAVKFRADGFHQAAAHYFARALQGNDDPDIRVQWLDAMQQALVPVETSSRREWTGTLAYSPDGRFLVSGGLHDGKLSVWATESGKQVRLLPGHPPSPAKDELVTQPVREIGFRPDRPSEMISVGKDGAIRVWNVLTGERLREYPRDKARPHAPLLTVTIDPSLSRATGRRFVTGDALGKLTWWDLDTLEKLTEIPAHAGPLNRVRYRPDGGQCASTGDDGLVRLWDPEGNLLAELDPQDGQGEELRLRALALPIAEAFAAGPRGPLHLLALLSLKPSPTPSRPPLHALAYSPDGRQLAASGQDACVYIWDAASHKLLHRLAGHEPDAHGNRKVGTLAYTSAERLVSGGCDGAIRAWDTRTGKQVASRARHEGNIWGLAQVVTVVVRPDGTEMASAGLDGTIRTWDPQTGGPLARLEGGPLRDHDRWPFALGSAAFCPRQHLLVTANSLRADAFLRSWDTRTFRERRTYSGLAHLTDRHEFYDHFRVSALAIHPDGSRFVSSESNGDLVWWDTESGKQLGRSRAAHRPSDPRALATLVRGEIARIRRSGAAAANEFLRGVEQGVYSWLAVTALAWSGDGQRLASAGADGTLKLWDPQARQLLAEWKEEGPEALPVDVRGVRKERREHNLLLQQRAFLGGRIERPQTALVFDRCRKHLISAGGDGVIRLWKLAGQTPQVVEWLRGHARRVNTVALGERGRLLASGSEDGLVVIWDLDRRCPLHTIHLKPLRGLGPLRPGVRMTESDLALAEAQARESYRIVRSLAFSPDERWLAVVLQDGSVSLVEVQSGAVVYRGVGHETDLWGRSAVTVYFTGEGELLTVGGDGCLRHWDLPAWSTGRQVWHSAATGMPPLARSFDPAGCIVDGWGAILHWSPQRGRFQVEWNPSAPQWTALPPARGNTSQDRALALATGRSDGKVVVATAQRQVLVLDVKAGKLLAEFKGPDGSRRPLDERAASAQIWPVAVQPTGPLAASAWKDGSVDLWRLADGSWVRTLPGRQGRVSGLAFSPDGAQLAATHADGSLHLWDVASGKARFPGLRGPNNSVGLCYSPDGKRLVQCGDAPTIVLWDPASGRRVQPPLAGHRAIAGFPRGLIANIHAAAYSPDGKWLATGGWDGTIRLWETTTYRAVAVLSAVAIRSRFSKDPSPGSGPYVDSVTFTADSRQLVAVVGDLSFRVYDLKSITDLLARSPADLLKETERVTGLRLEEDRLVPSAHNRLVRAGESLRGSYRQDQAEVLSRFRRINEMLGASNDFATARDQLKDLLREPGVMGIAEELARTRLAEVYASLGQVKLAKAEVRAVAARDPSLLAVRLLQARLCWQEARHDEALDLLRTALKEPGLLPHAEKGVLGYLATTYQVRGVLRQTTGRLGEARADYRNAARWYERRAQAAGSPEDVPARLRAALERDRRSYQGLRAGVDSALGILELDEGRAEEALAWFTRAIDRRKQLQDQDPADRQNRGGLTRAYLARSTALARLGRYRAALRDLEAASALDDGKKGHGIRLQRGVLAAREQGREPGLAELANYRQAADELNAWRKAAAPVARALGLDPARLPGSEHYASAVLQAWCLTACRKDARLSCRERKEMAELYAAAALAMLKRAWRAQFFRAPSNRTMLLEEPAFAALRKRDEFRKLRADLQAEAKSAAKGR
jgi:WD40 repeat protein/serine/threonine protein kinase/tetratricopeptide (TPR) repeat protein